MKKKAKMTLLSFLRGGVEPKFIKTVMEIMLIFQKSALKRETIKLKYPLEKKSIIFISYNSTTLPPSPLIIQILIIEQGKIFGSIS